MLGMSGMKLRSGNQMVAEGAIAAGCRFFAGYPITPASGIYKSMIEFLQQRGDVAVSAPDEISALAYCVGASMRGTKAMTATSGPGWALMTETVQYALMTETPVVIALVQRLGPSTGGATQGSQGDLMLAEFCTSGGYTIPMYCPSTPQECYELTIRAFNCAESLRTPVILLLDKEVAMTIESVDDERMRKDRIADRLSWNDSGHDAVHYPGTYHFTNRRDVPEFVPVGGPVKVTATGSAHNSKGELRKNDAETIEVLYHLEEKVRSRGSEITVVDQTCGTGADTLMISYGISARTSREVVRRIRNMNGKISFINLKTLFPVPEKELRAAAAGVKRVVVVEENLNGLYRSHIRHLFEGKEVVGVNKIGAMITPDEIMAKVAV